MPEPPRVWVQSPWRHFAWTAECFRGVVPATGPGYWMSNRAEGPRRARVWETSLGDNHASLVFEEFGGNRLTSRQVPLRPRMRVGLFAIESNEESGLAERIHELRDLARTSASDATSTCWHENGGNGIPMIPGVDSERPSSPTAPNLSTGFSTTRACRSTTKCPCPESRAFGVRLPGPGQPVCGNGPGLSALWPGVLEFQDSETDFLKEQLDPRVWWNGELPRCSTTSNPDFGQCVGRRVRDGRAPRSRCSRRRDRLQPGRIRRTRRAQSLDRPR